MLLFKNKKFILFCVALFVITGFYLFHPFLISQSIESSLNDFAKEQLHCEMLSDKITKNDRSLTYENVKIKNEYISFEADKLLFEYKVKPLSCEIDLHVTLFKPKLETDLSVEQMERFFKGFTPYSLIRVSPHISVHEGMIVFTKVDEQVTINYLQDQLTIGLGGQGVFNANIDKEEVKVHVSKIQLEKVSKILGVLWPNVQQLAFTDGTVDASGHIVHAGVWPRFVGEAVLSQIAYVYQPLQLKGSFAKALFSMQEESDDPTTLRGKLALTETAHLQFYDHDSLFWEISDLLGAIEFHPREGAKIAFSGSAAHREQLKQLSLQGEGHLFNTAHPFLNLELKLDSPRERSVSAAFALHASENNALSADLKISNFGVPEYEFLQRVLALENSRWSAIKMNKGLINASFLASFNKFKLSGLKLDKIEAIDLKMTDVDQGLAVDVDEVKGMLSLDLYGKKLREKVNADLTVKGGQLYKNGWSVNDINTELKIKDGVVLESIAQAKFAGLDGSIAMDWSDPSQFLKLDFKGGTSELSAFLPPTLQKGIEKAFADDKLQIIATVGSQDTGAYIQGELKINALNTVYFGFDLEKTDEAFWGRWPASPFTSAYWKKVGNETTRAILPPLGRPLALYTHRTLNREAGIYGFLIRNGWFEAEKLPLVKYLTPFIFPQNQMMLEGVADFHGSFNHQDVAVSYRAENLHLSNEDLSIEVPLIEGSSGELVGEHYYNLLTKSHFGNIPIQNGYYFEKNSGLLFTDINTRVWLEGEKVHLPEIETNCNGVYMAGDLDIDYSSPLKGVFGIAVNAHTLLGKVSQIQEIFGHFKKPYFFLKIPIDGTIALKEKGAFLSLSFKPDDYDVQAAFSGSLSDGAMACESFDMAIQDLSLNIDYDHLANQMQLTDIQGTVLVGDPHHVEEYFLYGDHIRLDDYERNKGSFDVWIGDKKRDIIRLKGETVPVTENGQVIDFKLDPTITHFGDVHPTHFALTLRDWSQVEHFDLNLDFKLNTLLHDLQRFSRSGLFFLSRNLIKELNDLKTAGGDFSLDFHYDDKNTSLAYQLEGEKIAIGPYQFNTVSLNGRKHKEHWYLDQLQLDNLGFAAELLRTADSWIINFLGVQYGQSLLMGMEGEYKEGDVALETRVNLFELNVGKLKEVEPLRDFIVKKQLEGDVRGTGTLRVELGKGANGWLADLNLKAKGRNLKAHDVLLADTEEFDCRFHSENGLTVHGVNTKIVNPQGGNPLIAFGLDKGDYNLALNKGSLEGLHFDVPTSDLPALLTILESSFPDLCAREFTDHLMKIKDKGSLQGSIHFEKKDQGCLFKLFLPEGTYRIGEQNHDLNHFSLEYDTKALSIVTQYKQDQLLFWLSVHSNHPELGLGTATITEKHPSQPEPNPLQVEWMRHPVYGLRVQKVEGAFSGLVCRLMQNPEVSPVKDHQYLMGEVKVDLSRASRLMSPQIAEAIKNWNMGRGYSLNGYWEMYGNPEKAGSSQFKFQGELRGKDFELKGYQFSNLVAAVDYSPQAIYISDLNISDPCGALHSDRIELHSNDQETWHLSCPLIFANDFRPGRLRGAGSSEMESSKPLVFRECEIRDLQGIVGEPSSFKGKGMIVFANPKKKNSQHWLFAIPGEIISRIGLDLEVLNPSNGTIHFTMQNSKLVMNKFKDVYSQGKLSKFNLAKGYESYLDFDGHLNVQVRMNQYNLLFKLAELFTVNVSGTIKEPIYSLKKQGKKEEAPVEDILYYEAPL